MIRNFIDAYGDRIRLQERLAMKQAWHTAALPLQKRFPPLSELLGDTPSMQPQTPEQMCAAMDAWVAVTRH